MVHAIDLNIDSNVKRAVIACDPPRHRSTATGHKGKATRSLHSRNQVPDN